MILRGFTADKLITRGFGWLAGWQISPAFMFFRRALSVFSNCNAEAVFEKHDLLRDFSKPSKTLIFRASKNG
jgi:hypothetical protein